MRSRPRQEICAALLQERPAPRSQPPAVRISMFTALNLDFTEWDEAFPNNRLLASATVDRLRHNAYCIELEGPSAPDPKIAPPPKARVANGSKTAHS